MTDYKGPIARGIRPCIPSPHRWGNQHYDDVIQEGRVGAWKAELKYGDAMTPGLAHQAARWGAGSAAKRLTGQRSTHPAPTSLEAVLESVETSGGHLPALTVPSHEASAALRLDVRQALAGLEPWERVFLWAWFWAGHTAQEAAMVAGVTYSKAQTRWVRYTRPLLKSILSDYKVGGYYE